MYRARFFSLLVLLTLMLVTRPFQAAETEEAAWEGAAERIERVRKAEALITVVDGAGRPVPGARVAIEQTRHEFLFGCNLYQFGRLGDLEDAYRSQFAELFNYATLPFYWPQYEPRQGQPNHARIEKMARWCRAEGITPKGHPLAWNYMEPEWLPDDPAAVKRLQLARITDCVSRFRGLIDIWDVVNEATHFEREQFRKRAPKMTTMWEETGRIEFVDACFRAAREGRPDATLLINDYRTDPEYVQLIEQMARRDDQLACDVIGIQSHMHGGVWTNGKIWETCQRFSRFNLPIHFTELTILSGTTGWQRGKPWNSTPSGETRQAEAVRRVYTMLFSHPSVTAITWWDFSDRNAWQSAPAGLVGKDMRPKPAYRVLKELITDTWWTDTEEDTDQNGQVAFHGFLGDYEIRVLRESGQPVTKAWRLVGQEKNEMRIVVE
ncbi:MAG: endo-1,4-beta-xylanase [Planctomycetota bacterium]